MPAFMPDALKRTMDRWRISSLGIREKVSCFINGTFFVDENVFAFSEQGMIKRSASEKWIGKFFQRYNKIVDNKNSLVLY